MFAALRTLAALVIVATYILLVAPPLLLWTALTRRSEALYVAGGTGVRLALALAGIRVKLVGAEHLQRERSALYAANHISNIDPPAVFYALSALYPRLRTLYKAELRRLPVLVWVFDFAGFVPVERANRDQSLPAVDRAAQALAAGNSFFVFPEGTRSRTGHLLPFKKGAFLMAIAAQAPVVPVAVSGSGDAMRKGSWVIHPVTVTIELAPPIETRGLEQGSREALVKQVRSAIEARLPGWTKPG